MCLILLALRAHPVYKLIMAANRDEFYDRPTAPASFWSESPHILGGRDLRAGGTWLGITRRGRIAAITNYRDPASLKPHAPSRGRLVSRFLQGHGTAEEYLAKLESKAHEYNGFNIVVGERDRLYWYSNRGHGVRVLEPGIYGVSNHLIDTPWPKVLRGKAALRKILSREEDPSRGALFSMLLDQSVPEDEDLPDTGVGIQWERILSPVFISSRDYGTRSSTVVLIHQDDHVTFIERTYYSGQRTHREVSFNFQITA
ncbi:MAG: NRDE family protein [Deltaproteobacteria bacterium]|nr:NRDE family protein [Deltaproteobacteria bacterium]MBW2047388.1 NRDE family protein [Deltaproteobacteria bacterium]MBW2110192.1 NRDE family protein [Deltaproteobacteria bacterium]MBW2352668.1 NRDE family protein [Deltaproteobacteria bacterium]